MSAFFRFAFAASAMIPSFLLTGVTLVLTAVLAPEPVLAVEFTMDVIIILAVILCICGLLHAYVLAMLRRRDNPVVRVQITEIEDPVGIYFWGVMQNVGVTALLVRILTLPFLSTLSSLFLTIAIASLLILSIIIFSLSLRLEFNTMLLLHGYRIIFVKFRNQSNDPQKRVRVLSRSAGFMEEGRNGQLSYLTQIAPSALYCWSPPAKTI